MGPLGQASALVALAIVLSWPASAVPNGAEKLDRAIQLMRAGDWQPAEILLDSHLQTAPEDPDALYWKAYLLFRTGRYAGSAAAARSCLRARPQNGEARKVLGLDSFMLGDAATAEAELKRATELLPLDAEARYYLGRVYFTRNNMPAALETFRKLLEIDPDSLRGHNHLGQTYEGLGQFDKAQAAYEKAIEIEQQGPAKSEWPYFNLGVLHLKRGRPELAISCLRQALSRNSNFTQAKVQLAVALFSIDQCEAAHAQLEDVLRNEPDNAEAHYQLGRLYTRLKQPEKAKEHFHLFEKLKKK